MPTVRRKATPEEIAEAGGTDVVRQKASEAEIAEARGEPGQPGHDRYEQGSDAFVPTEPETPTGTPWDAAKSFASNATLGAAPQIAGVMGAIANAARGPQPGPSDADAYRSVRDETARELAGSENTVMGKAAMPLGVIATPLPVKALPKGAPVSAKALQGAKVGGVSGAIHGASTSPGDLTTLDGGAWKTALKNAFLQGGIGAGGGYVGGATLGAAEPKMRSFAEEQALRASGLQAGIKNSLKTDLGLNNMTEARALGRAFLDEGLIPPVGSSEAVMGRAEKLAGKAGNAKGAVLNKADVSGTKYDYTQGADAARARLDAESAVATDLSGGKASSFADAFERQGAKTPGSFVGADKAKSDAWKSARFDQDAPMSAQLYRRAVGAARDDIERQVGAALGPDDAAALRTANEKFGVAADAQKLASNESQRRASRKGVTMGDVLALTTGGTAGGFAGHPGLGVGGGLAASLGLKAADKYGHATASRFSDWLAKRAAANSGGVVGSSAANALAPYLEVLGERDE